MKIKSTLLAVAAIFGTLSIASAPVSAAEVIVNGGFETGGLSPWVYGRTQYANDPSNAANQWTVTSAAAYSGTYSAVSNDNFELVQNFSPVSVASITSITFAAITPVMAIDLFYSGGSDQEFVVSGSSAWQTYDITSHLDASQTNLVGISFWGNTGGVAYLDNVSISTTVPEASTWVMMLAGFAGLGFLGYRRNKDASVAA